MSLYRRWIVACTAGELVGIGVATVAWQPAPDSRDICGSRCLNGPSFAPNSFPRRGICTSSRVPPCRKLA